MSYFKSNPGARRAYRARWASVWKKMLASNAVSPDEEETERKAALREAAGVDSSGKLTKDGYEKVMLHLGMMLGNEGSEQVMKNPWRASRIAKVEHLAKELRPDDPESYVIGLLDDMGIVRDPAKWRTALTDDFLHTTMLTLETQARKVRARGADPDEAETFTRGMTPEAERKEGLNA